MARIESSVVIDRPLEEVFQFVADAENQAQWSAEGARYERIKQGPIGIGSAWRYTTGFLGRRVEGVRTITEFKPNSLVGFHATALFDVIGHFQFEPVPTGTKVTLAVEGQLTGFYRWFQPFVLGLTSMLFAKDMRTLKRLLEERDTHGAWSR
jgi:uncharacterized membrane protein